MKRHWRENVAQDKNFNIKSSFSQRELYITQSDDSFIKDNNEPIDYRNNKFNCLRLCNTAALFPAADYATRESKFINNLVDENNLVEVLRIFKTQ